MDDEHQITVTDQPRDLRHVSGRTVLLTSVIGVIIGGPLIGLMGFIFLATMTLLLVTFPLLVIFSPILFGAACIFALVMIGFSVAGAMAVVGVSVVAKVLRSVTSGGRVGEKFVYKSGGVEGKVSDWAGYMHQKVQST